MTSEQKNIISTHARVWLHARLSVWKNGGNFVDHMLFKPCCKQQHFDVSIGKLVYCFHGEFFSFWDRIIIKKVNKPFIFKQYIANFSAKTFYSQIIIFHPYKQTTEYKQESLLAGRWRLVFLTVITAGKNSACQSINKSTEWHPRIPY